MGRKFEISLVLVPLFTLIKKPLAKDWLLVFFIKSHPQQSQ
ncbi:hypothetical protein ACN6MT_23520 [Neobacillus niacini]